MTKLVSVTARLGSESVEYIGKISKMFNLDKSTAFRNILQKGIEEDKKEKALELYMKGKYSIEQAARFADMYMGEFFELMRTRGIGSNLTLEDFNESIKHAKRLDWIDKLPSLYPTTKMSILQQAELSLFKTHLEIILQ